VNAAGEALVDAIRGSGRTRVAFLGLAKNVGKTTAIVAALEGLHQCGIRAAATSAGRDGEAFDTITGEPKPRFRVWPGQLVASASSTFDSASFASGPIEAFPFATRFGRIELRGVREEGGEIELIGPSTASEMERTAVAAEAAGARVVLLDGAIGRRAFAGARVADAVVLCVGMSAGPSLDAVTAAARAAAELIRLEPPPSGAAIREYSGAVTSEAVSEDPPTRGDVVVAADFTSIFLSSAERERLRGRGVSLAVRRPSLLLAVTTNPTAPGRPPLPARTLFDAVRAALPRTRVLDLVADLRSEAPSFTVA
jgi:hypothetical protein